MNVNNKAVSVGVLFFILFLFFNILTVDANTDVSDGVGGKPSEPGAGFWYNTRGENNIPSGQSGQAWSQFVSTQVGPGKKYSSVSELESSINNKGSGFENEDGSTETLSTSCKRSEYIWWYGERDGDDYYKKYWYTRANNTNGTAPGWQGMGAKQNRLLTDYKNGVYGGSWSSGKVVLICSGTMRKPTLPLHLVANSGIFDYDGTEKVVKDLNKKDSDTSNLKSGHYLDFSATKKATNPGTYEVRITKANVVDSKGKIVNNEYDITKENGVMIIKKASDPEDKENWRCVDHLSDSAKAYVFNTTTGSYGYSPGGGLPSTYDERYTPAGEHALTSRFPTKYDSESYWKSWKSSFESGSDEKTPELDLKAAGVSDSLSRYGGVYNISRSLQEDTYNVTTCQPQTRELETKSETTEYDVCTTNNDGEETCRTETETYEYDEWTEWEDDGERIVWTSSGPSSRKEFFNYQILSVNYNHTGFNSVRSQVGGSNLSLAGGHGGAVLKTPERVGINTGPLGKGSHITGRRSFYTDGNSIKNAMVCTSAVFPSSSNDARNNIGNTHLFTQVLPGNEFGKPDEDGNLIFFRDNEDREVRADLWYPKATGLSDVLSYSGSQAKETFAKIYGGTPEIELTTIAPWNSKSRKITSIGSEKNWSGSENSFLMKSQWSSDNNKPYEMGVNWEYKATGKNIVPAVVDGYNVLSMTGIYSYDFDAYCEFRNNSSEYKAKIPDVPYVNPTTGRMWNPSNAIRTLFSRSVSDTTN